MAKVMASLEPCLLCPNLAETIFNCKLFANSSSPAPKELYFPLPKYQSLEWDCPIKRALIGLITEAGDE